MGILYQSDHVRVVELGIIVRVQKQSTDGHWLTVREFTPSQYPHFAQERAVVFAKEMSCTRN